MLALGVATLSFLAAVVIGVAKQYFKPADPTSTDGWAQQAPDPTSLVALGLFCASIASLLEGAACKSKLEARVGQLGTVRSSLRTALDRPA